MELEEKKIYRESISDPGTGKIMINKRDIDEYFGLETLKVIVRQPLNATDTLDKFDVLVNVRGGGFTARPERSVTAFPVPCCRQTLSIVHPESSRISDP